MKKINLVLLTLVIIVSCSRTNSNKEIEHKKSSQYINIQVVDELVTDDILLDSLIKDIKYIPLETNDSCLIGKVYEVLSDTSCLIIHDQNSNKILRFDLEGNFLNKIGKVGKGPDEFIEAYDVSINRHKNIISVMDLAGRKYQNYYYDGRHVETVKMNILGNEHEIKENDRVIDVFKCYNKKYPELEHCKIAFADYSDNLKGKNLCVNTKNRYHTLNGLKKFNDEIYYNDPFLNRIFKINKQNIELAIEFDFGSKGWDKTINTSKLTDKQLIELIQNNNFFNGEYVLSDSLLCFQYTEKGFTHNGLFNIFTQNGIIIKGLISTDNELQISFFDFPKWLSCDNKFISLIEPYDLLSNKSLKEKSKRYSNSIEYELLEKLNLSDNPILIVYKFQEF